MKLISMTDFVIENENMVKQTESEMSKDLFKLAQYANFLKQQLELWMFVPCDENGDVLEEPGQNNIKYDIYYGQDCLFNDNLFDCDLQNYQQAKERCLFKGFYLKTYDTDEFDNIESVIKYEHCYVGIKYKNEDNIRLNDISKTETIEHLLPNDLQLTQTAIKQLGL